MRTTPTTEQRPPTALAKTKRRIHGILLLDKRIGITSNRALQEVKRFLNANKAGHTGSLDPLATGLLPICLGEATKLSGLLLNEDKRYEVAIRLGVKTDTGDSEGEVQAYRPVPALAQVDWENLLERFRGEISQIPPMYSALKHQGKKLYELARAGKTVDRLPRQVNIHELRLLGWHDNELNLHVHCSKGTYIRTLAEDIGETLGCGATVVELRRTQVGAFDIKDALTFEQLSTLAEPEIWSKLKAVDAPLQALPPVHLDQQAANAVLNGQQTSLQHIAQGRVRMYHGNSFLGLGEMALDGKLVPKKIFNLATQVN